MSTFDPYTPCDDAYAEVEHEPHSYIWADQVYECRGYPYRVVISRSRRRTDEEVGRILKYVYGGADMDNSVGPPYIHRFVPPPAVQQKEALHHRLMDWLVDLSPLEFYSVMFAGVFIAGALLFTVVWAWVMF